MAVVGFDAVHHRALVDPNPSTNPDKPLTLTDTDVDGLTQLLLRGAARCLPGFFDAPVSPKYQPAVQSLLESDKRDALFDGRWVVSWSEFASAMGEKVGMEDVVPFAVYAEQVGAVLLLRDRSTPATCAGIAFISTEDG